jgi:hypothetical protein
MRPREKQKPGVISGYDDPETTPGFRSPARPRRRRLIVSFG